MKIFLKSMGIFMLFLVGAVLFSVLFGNGKDLATEVIAYVALYKIIEMEVKSKEE